MGHDDEEKWTGFTRDREGHAFCPHEAMGRWGCWAGLITRMTVPLAQSSCSTALLVRPYVSRVPTHDTRDLRHVVPWHHTTPQIIQLLKSFNR
jgi:hypothetical protein